MKNSTFVAFVFIAAISIVSQLFAQESTLKTPGNVTPMDDWQVRCRVITSQTGCTLVFENTNPSKNSLSKKGYDYYQAKSEFSVNASDNSVTKIVSPRDASSGLPTGKRQHKPITILKELDKSSPALAKTNSNIDEEMPNAASKGGGKVNIRDFSFTKKCDGKSTKISCDGDVCDIPMTDCKNGTCTISADWFWGTSQSDNSKRCAVNFLLKIENGVCTSITTN